MPAAFSDSSTARLRVLELRHAETEPPGAYSAVLDELAEVHTVRVWRDPLPDEIAGIDAIVAMGGAMGVGDADRLPWLAEEIDFLTAAIRLDIPVWGVCLGSQLLAAALGADVMRAPSPEVGVRRVVLNEPGRADPVWGGLPNPEFVTVQWHFDTFALPDGAELLASSVQCRHQLFRFGRSYGVQFHAEAGEAMVRTWLSHAESHAAVTATIGREATDRFPHDAAQAEVTTVPMAHAVMRRWLDLVARNRR